MSEILNTFDILHLLTAPQLIHKKRDNIQLSTLKNTQVSSNIRLKDEKI